MKKQTQMFTASSYARVFRPFGLTITIQTHEGIMGIKSHWGGHQLCIFYPKTSLIPQKEVYKFTKIMDAKSRSTPCAHSSQPISPLTRSRLLAIDPKGDHDVCVFKFVDNKGQLQNIMCNASRQSVIEIFIFAASTENFSTLFPPEEALNPIWNSLVFICEIANALGGARTVNIGYNGLLTSEQLYYLGYKSSWTKASWYIAKSLLREGAKKLKILNLAEGSREQYTLTSNGNRERIILDTYGHPCNWIPLDTVRHIALNNPRITPGQLLNHFFF